jgi:hypothetical protein
MNGEAGQARRALNQWLRDYGPPGGSGSVLEFVRHNPDQDLGRQLGLLDERGFRPNAQQAWNGRELWQAFSAWRTRWLAAKKQVQPEVTDLYATARASRR